MCACAVFLSVNSVGHVLLVLLLSLYISVLGVVVAICCWLFFSLFVVAAVGFLLFVFVFSPSLCCRCCRCCVVIFVFVFVVFAFRFCCNSCCVVVSFFVCLLFSLLIVLYKCCCCSLVCVYYIIICTCICILCYT